MVICSDGSRLGDAVLPAAARWGSDLELAPWLVEVIGPDESVSEIDEPRRDLQAEMAVARLGRLSESLVGRCGAAEVQALHGADPARSIVAFGTRLPASLIAMVTHGRAGFGRLSLGSITANVVRQATCPVLVIKPPVGSSSTAK